jgi:MoaA/NifB/PqqE/SkfB family radical SAM enzyme
MIWAELGQECQLACLHCYAGAGPGLGWGTMAAGDWERVIGEAAGLGVEHVTFIGGEPTLFSGLPGLVRAAVGLGLTVEVYSNLVHVTPELWEVFGLAGVSLAVSWYTDDRAQHAVITGGHDTWRQTRANVARAVELGIAVRAGVVDGIVPGQRAGDGAGVLRALGVGAVGADRVREFGRGTVAAADQACGNCGRGRAAVLSDGSVTPCPMTRWLSAGNVRDTGLGVIAGAMPGVAAVLPGRAEDKCDPDKPCDPDSKKPPCAPDDCRPDVFCRPLCTPGMCRPNLPK